MPIQRPPQPPPRPTALNHAPRLSVPTPPSAWRGPAAQVQRPPKPPIAARQPCGFCGRVRAWVVRKVGR
jgi:hypothetical protein